MVYRFQLTFKDSLRAVLLLAKEARSSLKGEGIRNECSKMSIVYIVDTFLTPPNPSWPSLVTPLPPSNNSREQYGQITGQSLILLRANTFLVKECYLSP